MTEREDRAGALLSELVYRLAQMVAAQRYPADPVVKENSQLVRYAIERAIDEGPKAVDLDVSFTFIVNRLRGSLALQAFDVLLQVSAQSGAT